MGEWFANNFLALFGYLISAGFFTWILRDRVKQKSERKSLEATAMRDMQSVYDSFVKNTKEEINELHNELQILKDKYHALKDDYWKLEEKYNELKKQKL
jgi:predicted nuclease with TOPRIM domain